MLRKIVMGLVALGLLTVVAPTPAQADHNQGAVVFGGSAVVSPGLCFPGLHAEGSDCVPDTADPLDEPASTWEFTIPSPLPVLSASVCAAVGSFNNGDPATSTECEIRADGIVQANALGVGPSCGMSYGTSEDSGDNDPNESDIIKIDGEESDFAIEWPTSAGGTLPLIGEMDGETIVGVTQARPVDQNCATTAAVDFTVVGVVATVGV